MAWVNAIIQGVLTGGLYALFACGLSLMFGVMKVVNLAHGDLAVVAGYVAIGVIAVIHIPVLWSSVIVVPVMALLGYVLPVASAGGASTIGPRLAGWWLASVVGTIAVLLLSPKSPGDRLRATAAAGRLCSAPRV